MWFFGVKGKYVPIDELFFIFFTFFTIQAVYLNIKPAARFSNRPKLERDRLASQFTLSRHFIDLLGDFEAAN